MKKIIFGIFFILFLGIIAILISEEAKQPKVQLQAVKLYYYNSALDKDASGSILCSRQGLVPVERQIPLTDTPIQDTINLLIQGNLTQTERAQGVTTEYPLSGFSLQGASLQDGKLMLAFNDPNNQTSGGACRTSILRYQIEATAEQFPQVQSVKLFPQDLFQP